MLKRATVVWPAALPQEHEALRANGGWSRIPKMPLPAFVAEFQELTFMILQTGMGAAGIKAALEFLSSTRPPDLLLSAGFAGALADWMAPGDVFLGTRFVSLEKTVVDGALRFEQPVPDAINTICREGNIKTCRVVTSHAQVPKIRLHDLFADMPTVLDMETFRYAHHAWSAGIPFLSLRAISDSLSQDIDFDLARVADTGGRVVIARVLAACAGNPGLVMSFYRLWLSSRLAAKGLARVLHRFTRMSMSDISELTAPSPG